MARTREQIRQDIREICSTGCAECQSKALLPLFYEVVEGVENPYIYPFGSHQAVETFRQELLTLLKEEA